jgi:hypothetical protein
VPNLEDADKLRLSLYLITITRNDCQDPIELICEYLTKGGIEHTVLPKPPSRTLIYRSDNDRDSCGVSRRPYMLGIGGSKEDQLKGLKLVMEMRLLYAKEAMISQKRLVPFVKSLLECHMKLV